jgi:glucose-1-phosphate cytidylyltransferase
MKVVILCGGKGTRLREETEFRPKPMVEIGGQPILWHIMRTYAFYGFNDFILCLGYKGEVIREYFYQYAVQKCDFTVNLRTGECEFYGKREIPDWRVTLVDTGDESMTGARVKRIEKFIDGDLFFLTYGDGLTDLNIRDTLNFHQANGKIGTVTGVSPPSRYGELIFEGNRVLSFQEKPENMGSQINGGYFVFSKEVFSYLDDKDDCVLEREPLERLARDDQLRVYSHTGFWQCMDTFRDYTFLKKIWQSGQACWKVQD